MSCQTVICLFVKPPVPGKVKTRLAKELGDEKACMVYVNLVEQILQQIQYSGLALAVFFDGDQADRLPVAWCATADCCHQQVGHDLGERMANAFRQLFATGHQSVLLCGSDIVGIDAGYLQQAAEKLEQSGMVIAPAYDGGYCLIGFTAERFTSQVFEKISWSTDQVLLQTLEQCERVGISPVLLDMLRDIDTLDDLKTVCPSPKHHTRLDTQMT